MATKFGMRGRNVQSRQHLIYLGCGALMLSALTLGTTVLMSGESAEAHEKMSASAEPLDKILAESHILVAKQAIDEGAKLTPEMFNTVSVQRDLLPEGAIRAADFQGDMYAKAKIDENKPLLRDMTSAAPLFGTVIDGVKPGYRAATIEVDSTAGVEGWATAGAHVDVIVTYLDPEDGKKKSQIAIEDAVVLSFNRNTKRGGDASEVGKLGTQTATVTLSLPTMDAVKLHTAIAMGRIGLILRSPDDIKSVGQAEVTGEDFKLAGKKQPQKLANSSSGRASFTDKNGQTRELELNENNWTANDL